jgi:adenylate cyclase
MSKFVNHRLRASLWVLLVVILLLGLPLAVWLDLRQLTDEALRRQAVDFNSLITSVRDYYANNVVARVLAGAGATQVTHNYQAIPGAIPIPATLSLELGRVISEKQRNISYRFVSDFPFQNRAQHILDDFEKNALSRLRVNPNQLLTDYSNSIFSEGIRLISPILMSSPCVSCHNTHPESTKRDWNIGDVRGIQEISVAQPIALNIFSFEYLLIYFAAVAATGLTFILVQHRQAALINSMNKELENANEFLASVSSKISRYLPPPKSTTVSSVARTTQQFGRNARSLPSSFPTSPISRPPLNNCSRNRLLDCSMSILWRCRASHFSMVEP